MKLVVYIGNLLLFIHSFIHSSMALQSFLGSWPLLQFRNLFHTDGRSPWTSNQHVTSPLPTHRTTQTPNKRTNRYSCLELDSKSRSKLSSERREFMPAATAQYEYCYESEMQEARNDGADN
jgi:hypothetical protein